MADNSDTSQPWLCEVSLYKRYMYEGSNTQEIVQGSQAAQPSGKAPTVRMGATRSRPLGPWREQHAESFAFATVYSEEEVQEVLYWAQLAILNPGMPFEVYMPGRNANTTAKMQVKFSPNVVRLDVSTTVLEPLLLIAKLAQISGPALPNLAFYDLPGVINVAEVVSDFQPSRSLFSLTRRRIRKMSGIWLIWSRIWSKNTSEARIVSIFWPCQ